jgi:putative transcriptional regulator
MSERILNSVQERRLSLSLTQEELAEKVQVSRQTIIAIEKGNYTPSVLLALKIARVFKEPVETLFTIVHEK